MTNQRLDRNLLDKRLSEPGNYYNTNQPKEIDKPIKNKANYFIIGLIIIAASIVFALLETAFFGFNF